MGRKPRPPIVYAGTDPPDWRDDYRLRWASDDLLRWAFWVGRSRSLADLTSDNPDRWRWRAPEGLTSHPWIAGPAAPQGVREALYWDARFELALFLDLPARPPTGPHEAAWRISPAYVIELHTTATGKDARTLIPASSVEVLLGPEGQEVERKSHRDAVVHATSSDVALPSQQDLHDARRTLRRLVAKLSEQEIRYSPAERVWCWEDRHLVVRRPAATTKLSDRVTERFFERVAQHSQELLRCRSTACRGVFRQEHATHRFCSETCQEREQKRGQRRSTRAPSAQSPNTERMRGPQTPGRR